MSIEAKTLDIKNRVINLRDVIIPKLRQELIEAKSKFDESQIFMNNCRVQLQSALDRYYEISDVAKKLDITIPNKEN